MIPVEKILDEIIEQAKQGSCKTCRWCIPLPPNFQLAEGEYYTHICEMQTINGIYFKEGGRDTEAYPCKAEIGSWYTDDNQPIYGCLAYQPDRAMIVLPIDDSCFSQASYRHMGFMRNLAQAIRIQNAIRDNTLAKLTAKLNEAKESLPLKV